MAQQNETLMLRSPSISDNHIVFAYAGDIWIADINGQHPRRLTVHQGTESHPVIYHLSGESVAAHKGMLRNYYRISPNRNGY